MQTKSYKYFGQTAYALVCGDRSKFQCNPTKWVDPKLEPFP